ncbi:hypothetical protein GCM10025734_46390 [Kitasatospora paranensis]
MDLRIFTEPQQGASYETLLRVARAAEQLGYDGFFRSDHYLRMGDGDGLPGPTDAWITLAGLARETERIRLGTLMTAATFRLPGVLAIQVAQVDAMSGGRVELGLGAGWFGEEHAAYGIPFPERRIDRLEEQLAVVTGLWETELGDTFDFEGTYYRLKDSPALPKPVQQRIPVLLGGMGPRRTPPWRRATRPSSTPRSRRSRRPGRSSPGCGPPPRSAAGRPTTWSTRTPWSCAWAGTTPRSPAGRPPSAARSTS